MVAHAEQEELIESKRYHQEGDCDMSFGRTVVLILDKGCWAYQYRQKHILCFWRKKEIQWNNLRHSDKCKTKLEA